MLSKLVVKRIYTLSQYNNLTLEEEAILPENCTKEQEDKIAKLILLNLDAKYYKYVIQQKQLSDLNNVEAITSFLENERTDLYKQLLGLGE